MTQEKRGQRSELSLKAEVETSFQVVHEACKRIARTRHSSERGEFVRDVSQRLLAVRRRLYGKSERRLSEVLLSQLRDDFMESVSQLEESLLQGDRVGGTESTEAESLAHALWDMPESQRSADTGAAEIFLNKVLDIEDRRGRVMSPAWKSFVLRTWGKLFHFTRSKDFDDLYANVMAGSDKFFRRLALPLVALATLDRASKEASRPMPVVKRIEADQHRARNALLELIELWSEEVPSVAEKYQTVLDELDQELITLAEYYRYHSRR